MMKTSLRTMTLLIIVLLAGTGCQVDQPNSPETHVALQSPHFMDNGAVQTDTLNPIWLVQSLIGSLGGRLNLLHSSLTIPPFGVLLPTFVSFSITPTMPEGLPYALERVYDFGPEGLQFSHPATLEISFDDAAVGNANALAYCLYYFNPGRQRWIPMDTRYDLSRRVFIVKLSHFSRYAFGRVNQQED